MGLSLADWRCHWAFSRFRYSQVNFEMDPGWVVAVKAVVALSILVLAYKAKPMTDSLPYKKLSVAHLLKKLNRGFRMP